MLRNYSHSIKNKIQQQTNKPKQSPQNKSIQPKKQQKKLLLEDHLINCQETYYQLHNLPGYIHMLVLCYFNMPVLGWEVNYVENRAILPNYLLSWTLSGGLMRLSSVRGPYSDCGDENPGIKQENIHNCSLLQLFWRACSHKRKRRTPSRRILKKKQKQAKKMSKLTCPRTYKSISTCPGRRRRRGVVEQMRTDRQHDHQQPAEPG